MKKSDIKHLKTSLGKTFSVFFPALQKKLNKTKGADPEKDLILVSVFKNKQTETVNVVKTITGWSTSKATNFVKQGEFPKVIEYNIKSTLTFTGVSLATTIATAKSTGVCVIEIK